MSDCCLRGNCQITRLLLCLHNRWMDVTNKATFRANDGKDKKKKNKLDIVKDERLWFFIISSIRSGFVVDDNKGD